MKECFVTVAELQTPHKVKMFLSVSLSLWIHELK